MHEPGGTAPDGGDKVSIVLAAGLLPGAAANVAACLAAGLAASVPGWAGRPLVDAAGMRSVASSHRPIAILRAAPEALAALMQRLADAPAPEACTVSLFPAYAQGLHDAPTYWERHARTAHAAEPLLGLGLHGPKRWVNGLTGSLPLWR